MTQLYRFAYARDVLTRYLQSQDLELVAVQLQGANCGRATATAGSEEQDPSYLLRNVLRSLNSMMMNSAASSRFSAACTLPSPHPSEPASTVSFSELPSGTVKFIV